VANERSREWYAANKEGVNKGRREKYSKDPALRQKTSQRDKIRWMKGRDQRVIERQIKVLDGLGSLDVLEDPGVRHVRLAMVGESLRKIYSSHLMSQALGIDTWTLKRWEKLEVVVPPSFTDDSERPWYTKDVIEFMWNAVKKYRAAHYKLSDFGQVVQHHWRKKNGVSTRP